jgi:hypothetical protein
MVKFRQVKILEWKNFRILIRVMPPVLHGRLGAIDVCVIEAFIAGALPEEEVKFW